LRALALLTTLVLSVIVGVFTLGPGVDAPGGDKLHHMLAFAALALPTAIFSPRDLPVTALLLIAFGAGIEVVQPYVGRNRELMDFLMDTAGVAAGAGLGLFVRRFMRTMSLV